MELFELMAIFSNAGQKIDALWEFFVTVHLAIFAGLFVYEKMKMHQMVIVVLSYIAFSLINLRAKIQEYEFYNSLLLDLKRLQFEELPNSLNFITNYDISDRIFITTTVHLLSAVFLAFLLRKSFNLNEATVKKEVDNNLQTEAL